MAGLAGTQDHSEKCRELKQIQALSSVQSAAVCALPDGLTNHGKLREFPFL
jgi:hypothetical protein